ncbi:MAG TPA: hypothetical protein PLK08_04610 [Phycisphaerae bacterium]|nr:hypothetical protein [Phycisphaerae bacterium]
MKKSAVLFTMAGLLAVLLIDGCEELYAVKAMREKQSQVRSSRNVTNSYQEEKNSPEARAEYKKNYTSKGAYKDSFLYEKETPLKAEKDLQEESGKSSTTQVKSESAVAYSGPNEMQRLHDMRAAEEKQAVAAGKPIARKIERSDVGLTDPINVPKKQNAEKIAPPAELLKPIIIDQQEEKTEARVSVPSKPKETKPVNNENVEAELKRLASKIENKPSVVLPKEESEKTTATPAVQSESEPAIASAATQKTAEKIPATGGVDWNQLSAAQKAETPAVVTTPAEPEMGKTPVSTAATTTVQNIKPTPTKTESTEAATAKIEAAPKTTANVTASAKDEKSADSSWETEFVEKISSKVEKTETKSETSKPTGKNTDENLDWNLPKKELSKESVAEETPAAPAVNIDEPATVEIKLAQKFATEKTPEPAKPQTAKTVNSADEIKPKPITATQKAPEKSITPAQVAVAAPKPAVPTMTDDEAAARIASENKRKVEIMARQVKILDNEKNYQEALTVLGKILEIDPANSWAKETETGIQAKIDASKKVTVSTTSAEPAVTNTKIVQTAPAVEKAATTMVAAGTAPAPKAAPMAVTPKKPAVEPVVGANEDRTFKGWPGAGMILKSGMDRLLSWLPENAAQFSNLRLMFSSNGGQTWKIVAEGLKQGRITAWTVPVVTSDNCRLKIVGSDDGGEDVTLAISEQFSVNTGVWETVDSTAVK